MAREIDKYNDELEQAVQMFETQNGDIVDNAFKHFFVGAHNMDLKESFFDPDLKGLKKYELWLNE